MSLTYADITAGTGSVQLDDGTHLSVYVQNVGNRHCVILPNGPRLAAGETATVPVTQGVPLIVESLNGTTVGYQVSAATQPGSATSVPSQTGNSGKYLTTDGSALSWGTPAGGGGGAALVEQGSWVTSHAYSVGDVVEQAGVRYACHTAHTSGTFATDLGAGKWTATGVDAATAALTESAITNLTTDLAAKAPLASPTFTGTPAAPTAAGGTNTTQLATTAFATAAVAAITPAVVTTAYAATITPAVTAGADQILNVGTLTGALTLGAPTGSPVDGQKLEMRFVQDGTGGRVITFNAAYAFGTDVTTALVPTAISAKWEMVFRWCAADSKWRALGLTRGF